MNIMSYIINFNLAIFIIFINEFEFLHKISFIFLNIIGVFFIFSKKRFKLQNIEKIVLLSFILYSISHCIYIFNENNFLIRSLDHPSRFIAYLPLLFLFRANKHSIFIIPLLVFSTFISSSVVLFNYFFNDVNRGYLYSSSISGSQHTLCYSIFTFFVFLLSDKKKYKYLLILASSIGFLAVVLSGQRGTSICIPIMILISLLLFYKKLNFIKIITFLLLSLSTISFVIYLLPDLRERYSQTIKSIAAVYESYFYENSQHPVNITKADYARYSMFEHGLKAFKKNPIIGNGRYGFVDAMINEGFPIDLSGYATHSHNQYISDLVMRGLFGFLVTVLFMFILMSIFITLRRSGDNLFASMGVLLVSSYLLFFMTDSTFTGSMHGIRFFTFFFFLLFYLSLENVRKIKCD